MKFLRPVQFAWLATLMGGYQMSRFLHFWITVGYLLFFVVHVAQVVKAGWNNFRAMVIGREVVAVGNDDKLGPVAIAPSQGSTES